MTALRVLCDNSSIEGMEADREVRLLRRQRNLRKVEMDDDDEIGDNARAESAAVRI